MISKFKKNALIFWVIAILFLIKGVYYCFYIPPWEAPDEPGHAAYVSYLYINRSFPDNVTYKPTLDQSMSASWWDQQQILKQIQKGKLVKNKQLYNRNNHVLQLNKGTIAPNPPLYYLYLLPFYILSLPFTSYWSLIFIRLATLFLGFFSLLLMYKITQLLFPKSFITPVLVMAFVVLDPMFTFITAVVNNDNMVLFCFLLFLYVSLRFIILNNKVSTKNIIFTGLITGLSTISKPQMFIIIPVFILYLYMLHKLNLRRLTFLLAYSLIFPILIYGYKLIRDRSAFYYAFDWTPGHPAPIWLYPISFVLHKQPVGIFMSFWGFFGWINVPMPKWIYLLILIILLVAGIGWIYTYKNRAKILPPPFKKHLYLYILSISYTAIIFLYDLGTYAQKDKFLIQGRYLLPVVFLVIVLMVQGLLAYKGKLRISLIVISIAIFLTSQILMYTTISKFYYHRYSLFSPLTSVYIHK